MHLRWLRWCLHRGSHRISSTGRQLHHLHLHDPHGMMLGRLFSHSHSIYPLHAYVPELSEARASAAGVSAWGAEVRGDLEGGATPGGLGLCEPPAAGGGGAGEPGMDTPPPPSSALYTIALREMTCLEVGGLEPDSAPSCCCPAATAARASCTRDVMDGRGAMGVAPVCPLTPPGEAGVADGVLAPLGLREAWAPPDFRAASSSLAAALAATALTVPLSRGGPCGVPARVSGLELLMMVAGPPPPPLPGPTAGDPEFDVLAGRGAGSMRRATPCISCVDASCLPSAVPARLTSISAAMRA